MPVDHARMAFTIALLAACSAPAKAVPVIYFGSLNGSTESPANASTATGKTTVTVDATANTMRVQVLFSGLTGTTTAAHIHCCTTSAGFGTAGVATTTPAFAGFPLGVMAGTYDSGTLDLTQASTYNSAFVTSSGSIAAAEAALLAGIAADKTYLNIHTTIFPGGEIRAFLLPDELFVGRFEAP
jgi:hypothetical protein